MMRSALPLLLVLVFVSCDDSQTTSPDSGVDTGVDLAANDDQSVDLGSDVERDLIDSNTMLPGSCSDDCAKQTLEATFGTTTEPFERAVYGVELGDGSVQLYVEALHGGFTGCPEQSSPTPDRTLVISGLPLPADKTPIESGVTVSLLDFEGTLLVSLPTAKATSATVTFVAADVCPSCVGGTPPADPDGFVAFDLQATFADGTIAGRIYAQHCDSLDR